MSHWREQDHDRIMNNPWSHTQESQRLGDFCAGIFVGLLAGLAIGILLAGVL